MVVTVRSLGLTGLKGYEVSAECFLSGGLPAFDIVGLPDAAVREARERVRAAVKNCGAKFPVSRITVNLAPAGQKKEGTVYDLPILIGILAADGELPALPPDAAFIGELSLAGALRGVSGVLPMKIVQKLSDTLCTLDAANQDTYKANTEAYLAQLKKLDGDFRQVIGSAKRKEIIVGDRFPFRYFCKEYGLTYYAAFPGCSTDTEADASTVAFLIKKVREDQIPVVFHIELSNEQMCNSICEATGAKSELLNAVHNVSDSDFKAGATYVSLMEHNVDVLKEALN